MKVDCQRMLGHRLPLADYLLKPVQRLLKYPLLLTVSQRVLVALLLLTVLRMKELLKATPEGSLGYPEFQRAATVMREVAARINEVSAASF